MLMLQVASLGKSGVSVGYFDTEEQGARAYDRAAIGLLGRDNCSVTTNFPLKNYADQEVGCMLPASHHNSAYDVMY